MRQATEILLNVAEVTHRALGDSYEFILNPDLAIVECIKIQSLRQGIVTPIHQPAITLEGKLFELNHVRVNPNLDNSLIIQVLTDALSAVGVQVKNRVRPDSMAICYRPLGEISENVRMYLGNHARLIFLSPAAKKLRVV